MAVAKMSSLEWTALGTKLKYFWKTRGTSTSSEDSGLDSVSVPGTSTSSICPTPTLTPFPEPDIDYQERSPSQLLHASDHPWNPWGNVKTRPAGTGETIQATGQQADNTTNMQHTNINQGNNPTNLTSSKNKKKPGEGPPGGGNHSPTPESENGNKKPKLIIKTGTHHWNNAFMQCFHDLFQDAIQLNVNDINIKEDQDTQQFVAMYICRIVTNQQHACTVQDNDFDDFFNYDNDTHLICGTNITHSLKHVLTGISYSDPNNRFSPCSHIPEPQQSQMLCLRPAIVKITHILQEILSQYELEVHYDTKIEIKNDLICSIIYPALRKCAKIFDDTFIVQSKTAALANTLQNFQNQDIEDLEQSYCDFILSPELSDQPAFKHKIRSAMSALNALKTDFRDYESTFQNTSDFSELVTATVKSKFNNINLLKSFLSNDSSPEMPWIKAPSGWVKSGTKSESSLDGDKLKLLSNPSRICIPWSNTCLEMKCSELKDIIDKSIAAFASTFTTIPNSPTHSYLGRTLQSQSKGFCNPDEHVNYPVQLFRDADNFCLKIIDNEYREIHILEELAAEANNILKEIQHNVWKNNIPLSDTDSHIKIKLQNAKLYLMKLIKQNQSETKKKDVESRELSRNMAGAKAPTLLDTGENIQEFIDYHLTFKAANPLARSIKIKEGLPKGLKTRVLNVTDPQEIIELLSSLYLAEDVLIPLARKEVEKQRCSPPIHSSQEAAAYSSIFGFIQKLDKQSMIKRLDFTTIAMATSKLSKQRQDEFEKSWMMEQFRMKGVPLDIQEDRKRELFIDFIKIHESLLHRRQLQNSLQGGEGLGARPKEKEKIFQVQTRKTSYDKKRDNAKQGGSSNLSVIECKLCKVKGGHPSKTKPNITAPEFLTSLARCPSFHNTVPADRISLVLKLNACLRCLKTTHTVNSCKLPLETYWLKNHDCLEKHNPLACPNFVPRPLERVNKTSEPKNGDPKDSNITINLTEFNMVKANPKGKSMNALTIYDNCADSHWISKAMVKALALSNKDKLKVTLHLKTIPDEKPFVTFQHSILIRVKEKFKEIKVYEVPEIGYIKKQGTLTTFLKTQFSIPIEMPTGNVHLLLGLKDFAIHPIHTEISGTNAKTANIKVYKSSTNPDNSNLIAGSISGTFIGGLGDYAFFTTSELIKMLQNEKAIDFPALQCETCKIRSKKCFKCILMTRPIGFKEQQEISLVSDPIVFNAKTHTITTKYIPTQSSFSEMFPPTLSNKNAASKIASKNLANLKRNGELDAFVTAFDKFKEIGTFKQLSEKDIEDWDSKGLPINYISYHGVKKPQTDPTKQSLRIVTNSSLNRDAIIDGKKQKASLNSVLPQAKPQMNTLVNITLQWISSPVSLLLDLVKAYNIVKPENSTEGKMMEHLRRLIWFNDPHETDPKPVTYCISPVHYGDACAAAILENVKQHIFDEMDDRQSAKILSSSSYVDDNAISVATPKEAFDIAKKAESAFNKYSAKMHEPIVSGSLGKYDTFNEPPRSKPNKGEEPFAKIFGFNYSPFEDTIILPIQRNVNSKKQGIRIGNNISPEEINQLQITMRSIVSFQASIYDFMGFLTPLLVRGKILLSKVQEILPPVSKQNWDSVLPPNLLREAREYMITVISIDNPKFKRHPPPGNLTELHIHHDGSTDCFASAVWGVWIDTNGSRKGKLMFSKTRVAKRTIPDQELSSAFQATQIASMFINVFPKIKTINFFGDSESTQSQIKSQNRPKDVFKANKINAINSNLLDFKDKDIKINWYLIRSENNFADSCTKPLKGADKLIQSKAWLEGPSWLELDSDHWPLEQLPEQTEPLNKTLTAFTKEKIDTSEHIFSQLLKRVSNINIVVRTIAKIKKCFANKSFKATNNISDNDEALAFKHLVSLEQQTSDKKLLTSPKLLTFATNDNIIVTRQRWTQQVHQDLFGVPSLPVLVASSTLGRLLLQRAHRSPGGPCCSNSHAIQNLRTGYLAVFLIGAKTSLNQIKTTCSECLKLKLKSYEIKIAEDRFKQSTSHVPWSKIAMDMTGPILVCSEPDRKVTRNTKTRFTKKYILIVCDTSGTGAVKFYQMASASAASFTMALQTHFASVNTIATNIYTDAGSNFLAVAAQSSEDQPSSDHLLKIAGQIKSQHPNIIFESASSSSQYKNGKCEATVKSLKHYIKNVLTLKPNSPLPKFTFEGLHLLLQESANFLNSRPISWLKQSEGLTPNHFLYPKTSPEDWNMALSLEDKYMSLQNYRQRMSEELDLLMKSSDFLAEKWFSNDAPPFVNDIVFNARGKSKVNPAGQLEYGRIIKVSDDLRHITIVVSRNNKTREADSRNCCLIHRP